MVQKLFLRNEVMKVKGRVKAITIKKDEFEKFLQLRKLRILNKEYEALMPPIDSLQKNTIDINGLAVLIEQYLPMINSGSGSTTQTTPAQMVLTTEGGNITLSYSNSISMNSQGVTVYIQVLQESNNWTFQYYYIGFDTTNSSYSTSTLELYVSAYVNYKGTILYTNTVRIAYANISFTKSSDSYLFIVWLIEFQNMPPYLVYFMPTLQNNLDIQTIAVGSYYTLYFNNNNCNFQCNGNCPSAGCYSLNQPGCTSWIVYVQNNSVVLEIILTAPLSAGISNIETLFCVSVSINNITTISGQVSATLTPPVSGATFYVAIVTITITYQGS